MKCTKAVSGDGHNGKGMSGRMHELVAVCGDEMRTGRCQWWNKRCGEKRRTKKKMWERYGKGACVVVRSGFLSVWTVKRQKGDKNWTCEREMRAEGPRGGKTGVDLSGE